VGTIIRPRVGGKFVFEERSSLPPVPMGPTRRVLSMGIVADHSPPSSVEVKNV
jgi:hypothetical protein